MSGVLAAESSEVSRRLAWGISAILWATAAAVALQYEGATRVVLLVVVAPIMEEIVFRDLVWEVSARLFRNRWVLITTSVIFAAAHSPRAFALGLTGFPLMAGYLVAGLGFGATRARFGLPAAMSAHGVANATFLLLVQFGLWPWG